MDFFSEPWFWVVLTAVSELIGMNKKLKKNSIVEVALEAAMALKPKRMGQKSRR
jgi:hypothetical protein